MIEFMLIYIHMYQARKTDGILDRRNQSKASKSTSKQSQEEDTAISNNPLTACPECGSESVSRDGPSLMRCDVCLHSWK